MAVAVPTVEFLTRAGCPLCDEAEEWLAGASRRLGVDVSRIDVDGDPDLAAEFGGTVPVLRTPDGLVIAAGRWPRYRTFVQLLSFRLARSRAGLEPPEAR